MFPHVWTLEHFHVFAS